MLVVLNESSFLCSVFKTGWCRNDFKMADTNSLALIKIFTNCYLHTDQTEDVYVVVQVEI